MTDQIDKFKEKFVCVNKIELNIIDGFQGREMDVIILSLFRNNSNSNFGFIGDKRRINVAITRAKYLLVIIGNIKYSKCS